MSGVIRRRISGLAPKALAVANCLAARQPLEPLSQLLKNRADKSNENSPATLALASIRDQDTFVALKSIPEIDLRLCGIFKSISTGYIWFLLQRRGICRQIGGFFGVSKETLNLSSIPGSRNQKIRKTNFIKAGKQLFDMGRSTDGQSRGLYHRKSEFARLTKADIIFMDTRAGNRIH